MTDLSDPRQERIEALAMSCLEAFEREGEVAVERACAGNAEDEVAVLALLQSLSRFGLLGDDPDTHDGPQPGDRLGDFRLLQRLGGGGMGVVFLAEQQNLKRQVALKLLRPGLLDRGRSRSRFRREIELISALDHPGICTVYEAGEVDGRPYLAMRHVEGETLGRRLQRLRDETAQRRNGATSSGGVADTLLLVEKVARALHHAHERAVVHRDVKPGNVLVTPDGEPVLLDFGLAIASEEDSSLTLSGDQLGTPTYMAPEQVRGDRGAVDRRTDVYALGALLYECLALRPPFSGRTRDDLYRQILGEPPPDLRRTARGVGGELWTVVQKALDKQPRRRFATALDFAEELERIRRHEPIQTRRPNVVVRGLRWCQRNRVAAGVLGTALIGMAGALWLAGLLWRALDHSTAVSYSLASVQQGPRDPILAFRLAHAAVRLDESSANLAQLQFAMGRVHELARVDAGSGPYRVRFSPDGRRILVCSMFDGCGLFTVDGELVRRLPAPGDRGAADFLPTGELVFGDETGQVHVVDAAGSTTGRWSHGVEISLVRAAPTDGRILLVDSTARAFLYDADGERIAELVDRELGRAHEAEHLPFDAVWDPLGRFVVTADGGTTQRQQGDAPFAARVRVWGRDGDLLYSRRGPGAEIHNVDCAGDRIAAGCADGTAWLWSAAGERVYGDSLDAGQVFGVALDATGSRAAFTTIGGRVRLVERDGTAHPDIDRGTAMLTAAFLPDGKRLAVGTWRNVVALLEPPDPGVTAQRLAGHGGGIRDLALAPDGSRLVSCADDGTARVWQTAPVGVRRLGYIGSDLRRVAATSDGARLITTSAQGDLVVRDRSRVLYRLPGPGAPLTAMYVGPDDRTLLAAYSGGRVVRWDLRADEVPEVFDLPVEEKEVFGVAPLSDSELVVIDLRQVYRVRPRATSALELIHEADARLYCLAPCGDGRFAAGCGNGEILVLDRAGRRLHVLRGHSQAVTWVRGSADGTQLLSGSSDGTARLWDVGTGAELRTFAGHLGPVQWADFVPGGRRIVTGSHDHSLRVFDRESGREDLVLRGHAGFVRSGFVTADGRQVVSASEDGTIRWWWLQPEDIVRAADELAARPNIGTLTDADLLRVPELARR